MHDLLSSTKLAKHRQSNAVKLRDDLIRQLQDIERSQEQTRENERENMRQEIDREVSQRLSLIEASMRDRLNEKEDQVDTLSKALKNIEGKFRAQEAKYKNTSR